ncbi:hypothetical protein O181_122256 [Austropuccinia psidii MF-1]|uniref:Uncharacterized protein n=1 Tax=Austropuccinia psidii MF-1 TaxID=1389203 RepID=A0A9Q3KL59_9BASI|nr:hypothetical protein [Austropuccinia psidii MF-1]
MSFSLVSSISEISSDSEASESSIEIQTSPASRGLITKEPFKGPAGEINIFLSLTQSIQVDLDQDIQVINPKDKNVSPEERHKWRMPELPPVSKGSNRDIPVLVQKMVYGRKTERVGTSPKSLDRNNELISSGEEFHLARKDRGISEGLDTHILQRTIPTDKSLVEKPNHVIRGPEDKVGPREGKKPSGSSPSLNKCQTSTREPQRPTRRASKMQRERQSPSETSLTCRITGFPRKRRQQWTMCLIWQEL